MESNSISKGIALFGCQFSTYMLSVFVSRDNDVIRQKRIIVTTHSENRSEGFKEFFYHFIQIKSLDYNTLIILHKCSKDFLTYQIKGTISGGCEAIIIR